MSAKVEMMKCDWCGKEFPADARACVEAGYDFVEVEEDIDTGEEWKTGEPAPIPPNYMAYINANRDRLKQDLNLTDAELDTLVSTGEIDGLGAIICLECQESGTPCDEEEDE